MKDLFGKCGNNCARCPLYRDNLITDEDRQWCADGMAKYINWHPKPEKLRQCEGCQATDGFLYIKNCRVRKCAQYNDVENCAYCSAFPCQEVPTVSLSVDYKDMISKRMGRPIPKGEYLSFIEPYEGMKHLEEIRASLSSEDFTEPAKVKPIKARIIDFPDDLPLSNEERFAYEALHRIFMKIMSAPADTRARQLALKRIKKNVLNILWVFGKFGELKVENGSRLTIDGKIQWSQPDFNNIVRKRDNSLHVPAAQSFEILKDYGVHCKHISLTKKGWLLRMSFDENVGGVRALKCLKLYVTKLVEKYGEPTYVGSSRYKGKAFTLFSKADMRSLRED
ncbi:MAG: DUF3795 domain-containing protein [Candidatus Methanofastidiosia archaeon]